MLNAVITLWKVHFLIEQNSLLMRELSTLSSRNILIQLSTTRLESDCFVFWRSECSNCQTRFLWYLDRILSAATNCFLKNKVRNLNFQKSSWYIWQGIKKKTTEVAIKITLFLCSSMYYRQTVQCWCSKCTNFIFCVPKFSTLFNNSIKRTTFSIKGDWCWSLYSLYCHVITLSTKTKMSHKPLSNPWC